MPLTRDQQRACHAYDRVGKLHSDPDRKSYKVLVNSLGPNIIRSGLVAAIAFIQRDKSQSMQKQFALDLAEAFPPEFDIPNSGLDDMAQCIRHLEPEQYMLVTRETLKLALWFKRALQAHDSK